MSRYTVRARGLQPSEKEEGRESRDESRRRGGMREEEEGRESRDASRRRRNEREGT